MNVVHDENDKDVYIAVVLVRKLARTATQCRALLMLDVASPA